jgi:hypothetical protein
MNNNNCFFGTPACLSGEKERFRKFNPFSIYFSPDALFFLTALLLIINGSVYAQSVTTYNADSSVIITKDARFDELVTKLKDQNLINQTIHGYRIQIYFGVNRQKASEIKLNFGSKYPEMNAYLSYQQPNFKIRIGDFLNRYEAQKFLKEIDGLFPTSFIVPDDVKLPPLK